MITGIVCEYNPFHNGHLYQIEKAKAMGADKIVCVMSGNFVQRGECAFFDKHLRAKAAIMCGADVVITQHSHCIGCYENYEGGHIVYGQGNFVFCSDTNEEEGWYTALLVELDIDKGIGISFYPIVSTNTGCDLAKGDDAKKILADFAIRNEEMKNGKWRDGWHAFCTDEKRKYDHDRILNAATTERETQLFAHFLDCEAA